MKGAPLGAMESLGAGSVLVLCEYLYTSADHRSALMFALRIAAAQGFAVGNDTRENGKQLVRTRTVSILLSLMCKRLSNHFCPSTRPLRQHRGSAGCLWTPHSQSSLPSS
jgi:hypothetical protein